MSFKFVTPITYFLLCYVSYDINTGTHVPRLMARSQSHSSSYNGESSLFRGTHEVHFLSFQSFSISNDFIFSIIDLVEGLIPKTHLIC